MTTNTLLALFAQATAARAATGDLEDYANSMQVARERYLLAKRTYDPAKGPFDTHAALKMVHARDEKRDIAQEPALSLDGLSEDNPDFDLPDPFDALVDNNDDDTNRSVVAYLLTKYAGQTLDQVLMQEGFAPGPDADTRMLSMTLVQLYSEYLQADQTGDVMPVFDLPQEYTPLKGEAYGIYRDDASAYERIEDPFADERTASWQSAENENEPDDYVVNYTDEAGQVTKRTVLRSKEQFDSLLAYEQWRGVDCFPSVHFLDQAGGRHMLDDTPVFAHTIIHADGRVEITERAAEHGPALPRPTLDTEIVTLTQAYLTWREPEYAYALRLPGRTLITDNVKGAQGGWTRFQTNRTYARDLWALKLATGQTLLSDEIDPERPGQWTLDGQVSALPKQCRHFIDGRPATRITVRQHALRTNVQVQYEGVMRRLYPDGSLSPFTYNVDWGDDSYFPTREETEEEKQADAEWEGVEPLFELPDAKALATGLQTELDNLTDLPGQYIFTAAYRRAYLTALLDGKGENDAKRDGWLAWLKAQVKPAEPITIRGMLPDKQALVACQPDGSTYNLPLRQALAEFYRLTPAPGIERTTMLDALKGQLGRDGARLAGRLEDYALIAQPA